uniref:Uncharacterized protein n=1 Tax=uncultured nuHF2 cluster bacterium HF0770_13K08 TaxID=723591 RepID=E7C705_9BACT|nr:hypothetical protein [uncultured nuHF2 cluster bacterium HF0770_13K08]
MDCLKRIQDKIIMMVTDNYLSENEKGGFSFINLIATIVNSASLFRPFLFSGGTI